MAMAALSLTSLPAIARSAPPPAYPVAELGAALEASWLERGAGANRLDLVLLDGPPA